MGLESWLSPGFTLGKAWKYGPGGSQDSKENPWQMQAKPWAFPGKTLGITWQTGWIIPLWANLGKPQMASNR